tara:strand:+ start:486 stop:887 length:402 start_codon:yes stop_codon:yes gene_type:complete
LLNTTYISDKLAMSISTACVVHCFFAPAFIIFSVGVSNFTIDSEIVHYAIIMIALPLSSFALTRGYRHHKIVSILVIGILGLSIMLLAVILGESLLSELGEQLLTLIGSSLVAYSHFKNYRTCQELDCSCHEN